MTNLHYKSIEAKYYEAVDEAIAEPYILAKAGLYCSSYAFQMPTSNDLWSCYVDNKFKRFENWEKLLPTFTYNKALPFFNCLVPTVDTVRYGYVFERLLSAKQGVLFTGETGVGKVCSRID